eukprot:6172449-Pleurochrysis_carterae.AAC.1
MGLRGVRLTFPLTRRSRGRIDTDNCTSVSAARGLPPSLPLGGCLDLARSGRRQHRVRCAKGSRDWCANLAVITAAPYRSIVPKKYPRIPVSILT